MQAPWRAFGVIFAIAFIISLLLTPLAQWLGHKLNIVAVPGGRRKHTGVVSRLGAIPVYVAFVVAVLASQYFVVDPWREMPDFPAGYSVLRFDPNEIFRLIGLLGGGTAIFVVGLLDDWRELSPIPLYLGQILAGAIAVGCQIFVEYVNDPISGAQTADFPYLITVTLSLFWLGVMMNTVNWLDGLDGLTAGVAAIACVVLFANTVFRLEPAQHSVALLPLALLGATLGFLPYNFSPAKIFLGSGAYFLGFVLGALAIIGGAKMAAILLVMGLPLLDVLWQVINRLAHGRSPVSGDRGHLHFRLLDIGFSQRQIVLGYYAFCAMFGGLALAIPSRVYKLVALVVMGLLTMIGFFWISRYGRTHITPTNTQAPDPEHG